MSESSQEPSSTESKMNVEQEQAEALESEVNDVSNEDHLEEAAEQVNADVIHLQEALLRLRAEMDNREKRAEREMIKARKFALESLMRDFIQVLDSFDQAIAQNDEGTAEGLALTYKLALKVLASHGLKIIEPTGQPFDPSWHEAIVAQPTDEHEPDTVLDVLQKGYSLNDRLIRPARVVVAKAVDA